MASDIRLSDFKRKFETYGVSIVPGGKHLKMRKVIDGVVYTFPLPTIHGRLVKAVYIEKARARFKLTPDDGVSDEEFNRR